MTWCPPTWRRRRKVFVCLHNNSHIHIHSFLNPFTHPVSETIDSVSHSNCPHSLGRIHESTTTGVAMKIIVFNSGGKSSKQASLYSLIVQHCQENDSWNYPKRNNKMNRICQPLYLWSCLYAAGHILESSMKRRKLSVIFTHSGEVREPNAGSILMGFLLSERNKLALFMLATSHSSWQLK